MALRRADGAALTVAPIGAGPVPALDPLSMFRVMALVYSFRCPLKPGTLYWHYDSTIRLALRLPGAGDGAKWSRFVLEPL